ncbi:MAG: 30S ribosomal protein S17 [Methanobacteriota archaeon]
MKKKEESKIECADDKCPTHGSLIVRGAYSEGTVMSDKMEGTVVVQRDYFVQSKKYERYKRSRSRLLAHNPSCVNAKTGDLVRIGECRRLARNVSFVVLEKLTKEDG